MTNSSFTAMLDLIVTLIEQTHSGNEYFPPKCVWE